MGVGAVTGQAGGYLDFQSRPTLTVLKHAAAPQKFPSDRWCSVAWCASTPSYDRRYHLTVSTPCPPTGPCRTENTRRHSRWTARMPTLCQQSFALERVRTTWADVRPMIDSVSCVHRFHVYTGEFIGLRGGLSGYQGARWPDLPTFRPSGLPALVPVVVLATSSWDCQGLGVGPRSGSVSPVCPLCFFFFVVLLH